MNPSSLLIPLLAGLPASVSGQGTNPLSYDYVIVGGGTAGLTLAYRLREGSNSSVAVIEAGDIFEHTCGNLSQVPAWDIAGNEPQPGDYSSYCDWNFNTIPQSGAYNTTNHYPSGKCFGGSSARGYMAYQRGSEGAYQLWADRVDDPSYTFENLLPYFERTLNFTPPNGAFRGANATPAYDASTLGTGNGPLDVSYPDYAYSFATWNPASLRESSETAFFDIAVDRGNIQFFYGALALRILFDGTTATGVLVESGGNQYTVAANTEVIISAGVFRSPQLLMVSGIGSTQFLSPHNIPVIVERPGVGQDMWDHIYFGPVHRVNLQTTSAIYQPAAHAEAMEQWNTNTDGGGILSNPGMDFFGFDKLPAGSLGFSAQSDLDGIPADWPHIQILAKSNYGGTERSLPTEWPTDDSQYATLLTSLVAPMSRGFIYLISDDMHDGPLINPACLTHPTDQAAAVAAYQYARNLWANTSLANITIGPEVYPGDYITSYDDILDTVRLSFRTAGNAVGTNQMGRGDSNYTVVDSRCRVVGTERLRVVDASVFPVLPPGMPMSTVYALAEKIAEDILRG